MAGAELEASAGGAGAGRADRMSSAWDCFFIVECGVTIPDTDFGCPKVLTEPEVDRDRAAPNSGSRGRAVTLDDTDMALCADVDLPRSFADCPSKVESDLIVALLRTLEEAVVMLGPGTTEGIAKE